MSQEIICPIKPQKTPVSVISDRVQRKAQSSFVALLLSPEIKAICRPQKMQTEQELQHLEVKHQPSPD